MIALKCAMCGRTLFNAGLLIGGMRVGPKCARKHGLHDPALVRSAVVRDEQTIDLFESETMENKELAGPTGIEAMVCEDIARRQALGVKKYGVTVAENPLPLDEWLNHAYEECLDQAVYLRRAIEEFRAKK